MDTMLIMKFITYNVAGYFYYKGTGNKNLGLSLVLTLIALDLIF